MEKLTLSLHRLFESVQYATSVKVEYECKNVKERILLHSLRKVKESYGDFSEARSNFKAIEKKKMIKKKKRKKIVTKKTKEIVHYNSPSISNFESLSDFAYLPLISFEDAKWAYILHHRIIILSSRKKRNLPLINIKELTQLLQFHFEKFSNEKKESLRRLYLMKLAIYQPIP